MATPATRLRLDAASLPLLTKAETLALLRGRLRGAAVPRLVFFSVRDWRRARKPILTRVASSLCGERLAVRSSAHAEDRPTGSRAGHYPSLLDVPNDDASLRAAIDHVASALDGDPRDQVLVQEMVRGAVASGVILTHDPKTGAPYYVIEYDDQSSRTDGVTAGLGIHKTLVIHHAVRLRHLACQRLRRLLSVTRELRRTWTASPIAIEFAEAACGKIAVLQLRPLVPARSFPPARSRAAASPPASPRRSRASPRSSRSGAALASTLPGPARSWARCRTGTPRS